MNIKILSVHGVRSRYPVVLAFIDGIRVRWSPAHGWECGCIPEADELVCQHITILADMLDDKVLGQP